MNSFLVNKYSHFNIKKILNLQTHKQILLYNILMRLNHIIIPENNKDTYSLVLLDDLVSNFKVITSILM